MKKYVAFTGAFAFALAMGVVPAIASANSDGIGAGVTADVRTQAQVGDDSVSVSAQTDESMEVKRKSEGRDDQSEMKDSDEQKDDEEMNDKDQDEMEIELEDDEDVASSLDDLKQKIEERKQELEDEEAITTPKFKNAMKNANEVRLAVHALLASRDLLGGGIGAQVSEIAKMMNDSVATTTNAEARIESRGFFVKIFFGGDKKSAKTISDAVERNQKSIEKLTELLDQANLSVDFKTALEAQITALEEAQARFQALAESERSQWGIFSWRF